MGRVIKFRAWNGQAMEYGGFAIHCRGAIDNISPLSKVTEQSAVMQFTGLADKNGVDIYEGDIVEYPHSNKRKGKVRSEVIFDQCGFTVAVNNSIFNDYAVLMACVVIGNIYQNQELLK